MECNHNIHGALQAIGYSLLVLFFVVGIMKTCGNFAELKRPEIALKMFIRFILSKAAIDYGLELMMALFDIVQGIVQKIMATSGLARIDEMVLPESIEGLQGEFLEAEYVRGLDAEGIQQLKDLWLVALIDSRENVVKARKRTTEETKNTTNDDGELQFSLVGRTEEGIEIYETSEKLKGLSLKEKKSCS